MIIDDKDSGGSGKSPTKFKERPSDRSRQTHPENVPGPESSVKDEQNPAVERQKEDQEVRDPGDAIREKVRRTIPKPGHPGKRPAGNPSNKGSSGKEKRQGDPEKKKEGGFEDCV